MRKFLIASNNAHKVVELNRILNPLGIHAVTAKECNIDLGDVEETGTIEGRVSKELKEICLVDQVYVKAEDGKQTVAKYLEEVSKAVGTPVSVKRFVRFETGEGIEKKQEDFAAEVAAQMNA